MGEILSIGYSVVGKTIMFLHEAITTTTANTFYLARNLTIAKKNNLLEEILFNVGKKHFSSRIFLFTAKKIPSYK